MSMWEDSGNGKAPLVHAVAVLAVVFGLGSSVPGWSAVPDIRAYPLVLQFNEEESWEPPASPTATATATAETGATLPDQRMAYVQTPAKLMATASALVLKAQQSGAVRIIVGVNTTFIPSAHLSASAAASQQQGIGLAQQALADQLQGVASTELRRFKEIPFMALEVNAEALELLASLPGVLSIEESVADEPDLASSNPVIGSPPAWAAGYDGTGQVVAVLDTGVDKTHPYFATDSKVVSEACFSSYTGTDPEPGSSVSLCPGGESSSVLPGSAVNCPLNVSGCSHGTHVAGIAVGNDHIGPNFGVARGAQLIAVQVFARFNNSASCGGSTPCARSWDYDQIDGLLRIYNLRNNYDIAAVNMSLGGGKYTDESTCDEANLGRKAAIDLLRSANIATVISSGNSTYKDGTGAPGCISSAIEVGNTTDNDLVAYSSNIATFVELLAPGESITSAYPGGSTTVMNGTSMSAPHVTGAWAAMKQSFLADTIDDVLAKLQASGKSIDDTRIGGSVTDRRRINLDLALGIYPGFTIFNDGDAALNIATISPDSAAPWIGLSPIAPFAIPAGGSQLVSVTIDYKQAPEGFSSRRLLIASDDPDENPLPDGVDIEVITPLGPEIVVVPPNGASLDFGDVYVGAVGVAQSIEVSNIGSMDLTISCGISGAGAEHYSIGLCPEVLAPDASGSVTFNCEPAAPGVQAASLDLTTNDIDEALLSYSLSCNSIPVPAPEFNSTPIAGSELDFGEVEVAAVSATMLVEIMNSGNAAMTLGCSLSGADPDEFSIDQCPSSVAADGTEEVLVSCLPNAIGAKMATLDLATNDADESSPSYELVCAGVTIEFNSIPVAGASHDFGDVVIDTVSAGFDLTVENLGSAGLTISCALSGPNSGSFSIDQCPATVAGAGSEHVLVSCQPHSNGAKTASLVLTTNDADEGSPAYGLNCNATGPPSEIIFLNGFEVEDP